MNLQCTANILKVLAPDHTLNKTQKWKSGIQTIKKDPRGGLLIF